MWEKINDYMLKSCVRSVVAPENCIPILFAPIVIKLAQHMSKQTLSPSQRIAKKA